MLAQYTPTGEGVYQLAWFIPAAPEVLVICAHPFPSVVKSSVNSLPVVMLVKLAELANNAETIKSPVCVVVTAGPAVLLETTLPLAMLAASGGEVESPETSHSVISTCVGEPTKLGVTTVAPEFEFTAYQISVDRMPLVARA